MNKEAQIKELKQRIKKLSGGRLRAPGAGAKPKAPEVLKVQCYAYIEAGKVEKLGGKKLTQEFMKSAVDREIERLKRENSKN